MRAVETIQAIGRRVSERVTIELRLNGHDEPLFLKKDARSELAHK